MLSHTHFYLKIIKLSNHYPKMKGHPVLGCPFGSVFVVILLCLVAATTEETEQI